MAVFDATERELADLRKRAPDLADSAIAAMALAMAAEVDKPGNSATSKSMCAARLQDAMSTLLALAPPKKEQDDVDEVGRKRAERRANAGVAAASDLPRP